MRAAGLGDPEDYTDESLFEGDLVCRQSRRGYRFSVDAALLAHFVVANPGDRVLELGAGCGIVSLVFAYRQPFVTVDAIEIQPQLCALARHNMVANGYGKRVRVLHGDVRQIASHVSADTFDLVLANPPYRQSQHGRLCPCPERAVARHQLRGGLPSFVRAAFFALSDHGRAAFVYPATHEEELLTALEASDFGARRLRAVYGYPGGGRRLVLVEAVKKGKAPLAREPSLYITTQAGGGYTEEVAAFYRPRPAINLS